MPAMKQYFPPFNERLLKVLESKELYTPATLAKMLDAREGTVTSRLRDLRVAGHNIRREHIDHGLYGYRLVVPAVPAVPE